MVIKVLLSTAPPDEHCNALAQIKTNFPAAGFPLVRPLGNYVLKDKRYTGALYELNGQVFRPLRRVFPEIQHAMMLDQHLMTPLPSKGSFSINAGGFISEGDTLSLADEDSAKVMHFVCCMLQPLRRRQTPEKVRPRPHDAAQNNIWLASSGSAGHNECLIYIGGQR